MRSGSESIWNDKVSVETNAQCVLRWLTITLTKGLPRAMKSVYCLLIRFAKYSLSFIKAGFISGTIVLDHSS